jgi:lipopolysaccharide/colanic/teichoic acid biosynthesis glycosyltransferase
MSFVGPRPERPVFVKQLEKIIPYYSLRNNVKPGITGWAQICYPYGASAEDALRKLEYDLYYIKNMSLRMDLWIIFQTIKTVLFQKGAR